MERMVDVGGGEGTYVVDFLVECVGRPDPV